MGRAIGDGLRTYYKGKIEELELLIKDKGHNLRRLEAQRNELNASGKSPDPADTSKSTPQSELRSQSACSRRSFSCFRNRALMLVKLSR